MSKCLYCNKELLPDEVDFHASCARKFFGVSPAPILDYTRADMDSLAAEIIQSQTTLTGVQPKISVHLNEHKGSSRLTIVGLWGGFILKPQTEMYPFLPEVEQLTMCLAEHFGIQVIPHSLIRMKDGELCYITRRIDRTPSGDSRNPASVLPLPAPPFLLPLLDRQDRDPSPGRCSPRPKSNKCPPPRI